MAETHFTRGKTHFTKGKTHFTNGKTHFLKPKKKTFFLLSLAPFFSKGDTERTKSHSKHPRLGNFLKFANKYWEKAKISLKIDQISFQKGKNSFQKCWNSFHKMPKLIFSGFGVSGGDWISHKKKPAVPLLYFCAFFLHEPWTILALSKNHIFDHLINWLSGPLLQVPGRLGHVARRRIFVRPLRRPSALRPLGGGEPVHPKFGAKYNLLAGRLPGKKLCSKFWPYFDL